MMVILTVAGALLPWAALLYALRATVRRFRPRRVLRARRLPVTRPGDPFGASVALLLIIAVVAGWAVLTRPLWQAYVRDARDYRENAAPLANRVSSELLATDQPVSAAAIGRGRFSYSLGPAAETTRATVTYYWRGVPDAPGSPSDPVESRRREGPQGTLVLVYRKDLPAEQLDPIVAAFGRIDLDPATARRRTATDLPLLLRSVHDYWATGYAGYLDTAAAVGRLLAGLPVLVPLYAAALVLGAVPGW